MAQSYSACLRILLACVKFLGKCPCPRCLVTKTDIPGMGSPADMDTRLNNIRISDRKLRDKVATARKSIFNHGARISGTNVKKVLDDESLVPTQVYLTIDTVLCFPLI